MKKINCNELLATISDIYNEILGENLVGIYIHGSIDFNCFNWDKSDIDFIVVINKKISQQEKLELLKALDELNDDAPVKGFEMSVVLYKYCKAFVYPTPYELHFSNSWLESYKENPLQLCSVELKTDCDLAAHFTVIKHVGIVLCGRPITMVFGDIPKECYLDSIRLDIQNAATDVNDDPVYIILNLCRVYAYVKDNVVLSKEQGAEWGIVHLPEQYHQVIKTSLANYKSDEALQIDKPQAFSFCNYILSLVFSDIHL